MNRPALETALGWRLALLQGQLTNQGDAWVHTVDQLARVLGQALVQQRIDEGLPVHCQHRVEALLEADRRRRLARQPGAAGAAAGGWQLVASTRRAGFAAVLRRARARFVLGASA